VAHLALIVVYFVGAVSAFIGIWLSVQQLLKTEDEGTAAALPPDRWTARIGPILIAAGVLLGLLGNFCALHIEPSSSSPFPAPSSSTDGCELNDGLFGLCGAGQLH
jgi:hypothetical protein